MRRGWRAKGTTTALPDESERAEDSHFLLSVYRVETCAAPRWEWTVQSSRATGLLAIGEAATEDDAQRQAERWTERARRRGAVPT